MNSIPPPRPAKSFLRRRGIPLAITGVLLAALFGTYMAVGQDPGQGWKSPMLIGVLLGLIMLVFGLYRALKGPSNLDYAKGGTNNEPE